MESDEDGRVDVGRPLRVRVLCPRRHSTVVERATASNSSLDFHHLGLDSLRLPRWTRWVKYHLRNLGGWVVGRGGLEGGWSDVSPREEGW